MSLGSGDVFPKMQLSAFALVLCHLDLESSGFLKSYAVCVHVHRKNIKGVEVVSSFLRRGKNSRKLSFEKHCAANKIGIKF